MPQNRIHCPFWKQLWLLSFSRHPPSQHGKCVSAPQRLETTNLTLGISGSPASAAGLPEMTPLSKTAPCPHAPAVWSLKHTARLSNDLLPVLLDVIGRPGEPASQEGLWKAAGQKPNQLAQTCNHGHTDGLTPFLSIPFPYDRNRLEKRWELQEMEGKWLRDNPDFVFLSRILGVVSSGLLTPRPQGPSFLSASPDSPPGQPLSQSQMGVLCWQRPLFKSSQSTDGACIASALTLLCWQSPW